MRRLFALAALGLLLGCSGKKSIDEEPPIVFALLDAEKLIWYRGEKMEITFTYESQAIAPVEVKIPEDFSGGLEIASPVNGGEPAEGADPDVLVSESSPSFPEHVIMERREVREGGTWDIAPTLEEKLSDEDQITYIRYRLGIKTTPWYRVVCIRRYKAEVETSAGSFNLEFLPEHAPVNVMTFTRRAKDGFYDGAPVFKVDAKEHLVFGDTSKEDVETVPQEPGYPEEGFGTVGMRYDLRPDSISHLVFIRFAEREMPMARFTIFAKVTGGDDVLKKIQAAAVGDDQMPKEEIKILKISVQEGK